MQTPFPSVGLAAALLTSLAATASAQQGSFMLLGRGAAYAVSYDGSVVTGTNLTGAYRWTLATGFQSLGQPGGRMSMSDDGSVISTNLRSSATYSGLQEAALWTLASGQWQSLGGLPTSTGCSGSLSSAYGLNADGTVLVGLGWEGCKGRAFRWDATNGMVNLGVLNPIRSSRANAVSGDGQLIGGWDESPMTGQRRAALWFSGGQEILIVPPSMQNPVGAGEVWGINHNGSIVVGGDSPNAFRWTPLGGFEDLGAYPGRPTGSTTGTAYATSDDGSIIVGTSGSYFVPYGAFIWTEEDGMQKLDFFLERHGIPVPAGPPLAWALDVSADGRYIVGSRGDFRALNDEGFLIELPDGIKYGPNASPANRLDLGGGGSSSIGSTFVAVTATVTGPTVTVVAAASARFPLLGGVGLVDLTGPFVLLTSNPTGGVATSNLPVPNQPTLIGASVYLQSLTPDASQPGGWALSNGLKVTVHS